MLDQITKRKIDSARQILVGKVPDPKAQVEQITTALVYKFMDDMDKESEELGGEAKFFANEFSHYSWTKLLDSKLSGQERLDLYDQAISNMPKNPNIPQLFRDIFKGAFLPYRDTRTLSLFLKEINEFTYEHSENLGNAFEYLLSILGSQGDAGQFRTPRHVIDFIVDVVNPTKKDKILDPACGTAGFLISAYKHILKQNKEKALTPDEKLRLMNNLAGYDISPDMVKLALVNMYLHGFPEPKIHEYDSLTSEKRWDENYDVILANPPFMTPKGGINPHKRFSVQSSRAEVLFVDYIIEHLTINGRAGIVVPEGVLGNSNASYFKKIRELILDNVWAIASLHPFTFAPYAEVNTYILFLDKTLAKKANDVLFVDINNDGFDKSSQRREIALNDLPSAVELLDDFRQSIINDKLFTSKNSIGHKVVSKKKIKNNSEYYLLVKKYSDLEMPDTKHAVSLLGDLITEKKEKAKNNNYTVWSVSNKYGFINSEDYFDKKIASVNTSNYKVIKPYYFAFNPSRINVGSIACNFSEKIGIVSPMYTLFEIKDTNRIVPDFLLMYLKSDLCKEHINHKIQGATRKVLKKDDLFSLKIPVPSKDKQIEILNLVKKEQDAINDLDETIKKHKKLINGYIENIWAS
ncbi:MAG: N-6 DNA methylase [Patescibacteria group bacterium]|nr:N-6 DNA methylase [Patescibacteria group bacterium]